MRGQRIPEPSTVVGRRLEQPRQKVLTESIVHTLLTSNRGRCMQGLAFEGLLP